MADNPWTDRFPIAWSDEQLDAAISTPAGPLPNLDAMPTAEAQKALLTSFSELTVTSHQLRTMLRRILAHAHAGAKALFPHQLAFIERAYARQPEPCSLPMMCITGLAGCGKTVLVKALMRALPPVGYVDIPNHSRFRLVHAHALTASAGIGHRQILETVFPSGARDQPATLVSARRQLAKDGVAILIADELQFVTQALTAARVTNLLLHLGSLGPPFVFVTNFSLLHRLNRKAQELKDRLLTDPLIVEPDAPESDDWMSLLLAHIAVHPAFAPLAALPDIAMEMQRRTYALKRNVPKLLALSYSVAREDGSATVHLRHVECAYLSLSYASARHDVELLLKSHVTGLDGRLDLWCPLNGKDIFAPTPQAVTHQRDLRAEQLAEAALSQSMTADEAGHLKAIKTARGVPARPERPIRPKLTGAALAAGARALANSVKKGKGDVAA